MKPQNTPLSISINNFRLSSSTLSKPTMAHLLQSTFLLSSPSLRRNCNPSSSASPSSWPHHHIPSRNRTHHRHRVQAKIREIFMPALSSTLTEGKIVSWVKSEGDKLARGESVVVVESDKADMDVETFYDGYLAAIKVEEGGVAAVGSAIALLTETQDEIAEAKSKAAGSSSSSLSSAATAPPVLPTNAAAPRLQAVATVASSVHQASRGEKRVVASPCAKKLAKELKVELERPVGSGPMGRIVAKDVEAAAAVAVRGHPC